MKKNSRLEKHQVYTLKYRVNSMDDKLSVYKIAVPYFEAEPPKNGFTSNDISKGPLAVKVAPLGQSSTKKYVCSYKEKL